MKRILASLLCLAVILPTVQAIDDYELGPDSMEKPGVPKGEVTTFKWESKVFPGTARDCWVYVPKQYDPTTPACVHVNQDGIQNKAPEVFDRLIAAKEIPVIIGVFVSPGEVKAIKSEPMYANSHARVVPAEVWALTLADIQSTGGSSPNLLAMISSDLADSYATILAKEADIADARTQIETEKAARDAKDASDADRKAHDKTIDELKETISKLEDEVDPLRKKFLEISRG